MLFSKDVIATYKNIFYFAGFMFSALKYTIIKIRLFSLTFESSTIPSENVTLTSKNDTGWGKNVYIMTHTCVSNT